MSQYARSERRCPMNQRLDLDVRMDRKTYRAFMVFDSLIRTGAWRRPALFMAIFVLLALLGFLASLLGRQGAPLGLALLFVGLLPAAYLFWRVHSQISRRMDRLGLKKGASRLAYSLAFAENPGALTVRAPGKDALSFPWALMPGAWRRKEAIYLYVQPGKAYVVPANQAAAGLEAYWAFLQTVLPGEKLRR